MSSPSTRRKFPENDKTFVLVATRQDAASERRPFSEARRKYELVGSPLKKSNQKKGETGIEKS
jgi:hypothetical protein